MKRFSRKAPMKQTVITIASPSGGVGKSTISKELAVAFSQTKIQGSNIRTCLVEANLSAGSQIFLFDVEPKFNIVDWAEDYRRRRKTMSAEELNVYYGDWSHIEKFLTYIPILSLYLLPAPSDALDHEIRFDEFSAILFFLKYYFDAIVIDTENCVSETMLAALRLADFPILIMNDDWKTARSINRLKVYIRDLEGVLPEGRRSFVTRLLGVMNKYPVDEKERIHPIEGWHHATGLQIIAVLPEDEMAVASNNSKMPIVFRAKRKGLFGKDTSLRTALLELAHLLIPEVDPDKFHTS